ncbi:GNAT family N-acetyltransferase [Aerosakkonema funiforme]|uniref:GNAT family N-acetyltransferase n=1 Tax=Aerosakkonema funiforme TaxID=1246630 RepID=UPI0035B87D70
MTEFNAQEPKVVIRPVQYRDLEALEQIFTQACEAEDHSCCADTKRQLQRVRSWYWLFKLLSWFPNPFQYKFCAYVAQQEQQVRGTIQISPFNRTRSTWRVEQVVVDPKARSQSIGSQLLRYCFETIWEARTWLLEVNIHDKTTLALYRQNGFQPLAQMTYWAIAPDILQELQQGEPDLPNLLPVSNADAQLLYQLDTASMPPLVRQVFDRHVQDFKTSFFGALIEGLKQWFGQTEVVSGYVFETQRKAAIGYFQIQLSRNGSVPHTAQLTVHPAYTWLYPELLAQMARIAQDFPPQSLQLASADYQPEREEYLEQLGAERVQHTLLMSRSVWHKLRESKLVSLEGLPLSEVLQGLQRSRQPVPGRMSWLRSRQLAMPESARTDLASNVSGQPGSKSESASETVGGVAFKVSRNGSSGNSSNVDGSETHQEKPSC